MCKGSDNDEGIRMSSCAKDEGIRSVTMCRGGDNEEGIRMSSCAKVVTMMRV